MSIPWVLVEDEGGHRHQEGGETLLERVFRNEAQKVGAGEATGRRRRHDEEGHEPPWDLRRAELPREPREGVYADDEERGSHSRLHRYCSEEHEGGHGEESADGKLVLDGELHRDAYEPLVDGHGYSIPPTDVPVVPVDP